MKDQDVFCPLFDWSMMKGRAFLSQSLGLRGSGRGECLLRMVLLEAKEIGTAQWGLCRGPASGRGDWGTISWTLGARVHLNMSEESIALVLENWHLTLQMIAQLLGTLIRQSLAAVEVLLIYYWREKEKTSANFWEQIIFCITHTDMHAHAGTKILTPKIRHQHNTQFI